MEEREGETVFSIWVDWELRVISFSPVSAFKEIQFLTYEERSRFAVEMANEGFGIQ